MSCDEEYIPRSQCIQNQKYDNIRSEINFSYNMNSFSDSSINDIVNSNSKTSTIVSINSNFNEDSDSESANYSDYSFDINKDIRSFDLISTSHNPASNHWGKEFYEEIFKIDALNQHKITCYYRSKFINVNVFMENTEQAADYAISSKLRNNFILVPLWSIKEFYLNLNYEIRQQKWNFRTLIIILPIYLTIQHKDLGTYEDVFEFIYKIGKKIRNYRYRLCEEDYYIPNIIILTSENIKTNHKLSYKLNYYELK